MIKPKGSRSSHKVEGRFSGRGKLRRAHEKPVSQSGSMEQFKPFPGFGTLATHEGQDPEKWTSRAVVPPISMSTTFKQKAPGEHYVSVYSN